MLESTNKRLKPAQKGETLLITIPDVDRGRGRGDHKNLNELFYRSKMNSTGDIWGA